MAELTPTSGLPPPIHLEVLRGDTAVFDLALESDDGPYDLAGCQLYFTAKRSLDDADGAAGGFQLTLDNGITVDTPSSGMAVIRFSRTITAQFDGRTLTWDLQVTSGEDTDTPLRGTITFVRDVTRAP